MGNSTTSKVIGKESIQFRSHDECITTLQGVHHVPESRYSLISLGTLHGEGFSFSSEGNLMEVFKDAHVGFKSNMSAMFTCCEIQRLQLVNCSYLRLKIGGCRTIRDLDSFELGCPVLPRR